jgi:AcrR family transcriptional regulator
MVMSVSSRNATTEARRQAILRAALEAFSTKGFTDTTMEDIRRISGASTGSIYHHFENKEKLALALYLEGRNDLNAYMLASMVDVSHPREGIKALIRAYLDWFEQHPDLGQYLLQATSIEAIAPQVDILRQTIETFSEQLLDWLTPFIEKGIVVRFPQHLYTPLVIGPSREFLRRWLKTKHAEELHEAREPLAEAAWLVLAPEAFRLEHPVQPTQCNHLEQED